MTLNNLITFKLVQKNDTKYGQFLPKFDTAADWTYTWHQCTACLYDNENTMQGYCHISIDINASNEWQIWICNDE